MSALQLYGRHLRALGETSQTPFLVRMTAALDRTPEERGREALLVEHLPDPLPPGFRAVLLRRTREARPSSPATMRDVFAISPALDYLAAGDIARIDPAQGTVSVLYRRGASTNSLLVTERCDNYCVMCSQPPRAVDDDWIIDELMEAVSLMSPETPELGITGGEPGLLGGRLLSLIDQIRRHLPSTALHVLSNGRAFAAGSLARELAALRHPDLMIGIPLYSALAEVHDYVVQARGAYDETVRGILALKRHGVAVELRVVLHRDTYAGLPELARFIVRNLLFVDHVALMGLELMGFARANLEALWIDPIEYQRELAEAVQVLARAGLSVSIFNHQLCTLDPSLHPFARSSISDWKREYIAACEACTQRGTCGGFFSSSQLRRSRGVRAI